MNYEYSILELSGENIAQGAKLNEHGSEGWELVAVVFVDWQGVTRFYFKRALAAAFQ